MRSPTRVSKGDDAVEDQQAGTVPDGVEPGREVALADRRVEDPRGGELAGGDAGAEVELLGEVGVGIQHVGVERL